MITTAKLGGLVEHHRWPLLAAAALVALSAAVAFRGPLTTVLFAGLFEQPQPVLSRQVVVESLTRRTNRPEGFRPTIEAVLITPELVASTNNQQGLDSVTAPSVLFYLYEEGHESLPEALPQPRLAIVGAGLDQTPMPVSELQVLADSVHHRWMLASFRLQGPLAHLEHGLGQRLELTVPGPSAVQPGLASWELPLRYGGSGLAADPVYRGRQSLVAGLEASGIGIATILGLFGGLLASMWPCLFQLTAYFIPSLAGISYGEARDQHAPAAIRRQVFKTALFFVLGIVTVYTITGAVIGYAAQSLAGLPFFTDWQRPLSLIAAAFIVVMAIRVAVQGRAPVVCKMPLLSRFGSNGPTGPVGTMLLGLAFATGCMTCFGAAIALGLVMYTLSSASALTGALLLFLFSLGISIPLVVAAIAMARVLPLLGKLERLAPWMALASSGVMIAFAGLLVSGQYHAVSDLISGLAAARF